MLAVLEPGAAAAQVLLVELALITVAVVTVALDYNILFQELQLIMQAEAAAQTTTETLLRRAVQEVAELDGTTEIQVAEQTVLPVLLMLHQIQVAVQVDMNVLMLEQVALADLELL
jgi:hypothetical protein